MVKNDASILDNETFDDILKKLQNKVPAEFITCLHKFYWLSKILIEFF